MFTSTFYTFQLNRLGTYYFNDMTYNVYIEGVLINYS